VPQFCGSVLVFVHTPGAAPQATADPGQPHAPLQVPPAAHWVPALPASAMPQPAVAPQYCVLLLGSMHAPPQFTSVPGHVEVHPPEPLQSWPIDWQFTPPLPTPFAPQPAVAPQCRPLVVGSMHSPPQLICVPGHVTWHPDGVHTSPSVRQFVPALPASPAPQPAVAPQYWLLVDGSTHLPLQLISLPGHETEQLPPLHTSPAGHCVPGLPASPSPHAPVAPQYWSSLDGSMHRPLQFTSVPGHEIEHLPSLQALPDGHRVLHPPQWFGSFCSSTHRGVPPPSPPGPGHIERPPPHCVAHWPAEQSWPLGQACPQPPQLLGSTFVSMQAAPHCVVPPPQLSEHCPLEHTWPPVHVLLQEPQLLGSVFGSTHTPLQDVWPLGQLLASLAESAVPSLVTSETASVVESVVASEPPSNVPLPSLDASLVSGLLPGDEEHAVVMETAPRASASPATEAARRNASPMSTSRPRPCRPARQASVSRMVAWRAQQYNGQLRRRLAGDLPRFHQPFRALRN
jgi:hypothetical protein